MANKLLLLFLLFATMPVLAQADEQQVLKGRVQVDGAGLYGVFIINTTTGAETKTDTAGYFTIAAQPNDGLAVYNTKITTRKFVLKPESFENQPLIITVSNQAYELDEVVMDKDMSVDEVSLGLVPADQKQYTVAERRVFTATSGILDPIINAISGRTKMLKKELQTEKKEVVLEEAQYLYTNEEVIEKLKIPKAYVEGFWYYAAEDPKFSNALKNNDEGLARILLYDLAKHYLELLNSKNE